MPGENKLDWSTTAISNGSADSSITLVEGQTRASLNDAVRSVMASEAKARNYQNGTITTSGTAAAQTFTSGVGFSSMPSAGMVATLKMGFTNPAAFTLNMDGTGANTVKDQLGNTTVGSECLVNTYSTFLWNGTNWVLIASGVPLLGNIAGRTDGTSPAVGKIGEVLSVGPTSGGLAPALSWWPALSLALTAGDWDVTAALHIAPVSNTSQLFCSISGSSVVPGESTSGYTTDGAIIIDGYLMAPPARVLISSTVTYYCMVYSGQNFNFDNAYIRARRSA